MAAKYVVKNLSDVPREKGTCGHRQRLITKDDSDLANFSFLTIRDAPRHRHEKTTEFYYIVKGSGTLEIDEDRVPIEPGTMVMIPPGVWHRIDGEIEVLVAGMPCLDPADNFLD